MRTAKQQLIHMVNQIAENNQHGGEENAASVTCVHMQKFWARSMKADIIKCLETDADELSAAARSAIKQL
ncbi:MAG: formate dehydrogenase subunit delta [Oceanospirillaceae bacterium]|jgi:formate dehydrogenase subunit delta